MKRTSFHSYFGGKNKISKTLISPRIPSGIKTYVEPFSGSFAVYFQTDFEDDVKVVYNDWNKDQMNLFYCSKDYKKLESTINYHLENKDGLLYCPHIKPEDKKEFFKKLYYDTKKSDFSTKTFEVGDFDRASMYAFLLTSAFNSCHYMAAGFSGFNKERMKIKALLNKLNNEYIHYKFDRISHIENMDFADVIKKYDSKDTFFYVDAPYAEDDGIKEKGNNRLNWYGVESESAFGPSSHKRLCDLLKTVKGKWSVSYYDFPELSEWLPKDEYHWFSEDFFRSSASFSDSKDTKGTEILITNYEMSEEEYKKNFEKYNSEKRTTKPNKALKSAAKKHKEFTKPSEELLDKVLKQVKEDIETDYTEAVYELLSFIPIEYLEGYLPELEMVEEVDFKEIAKKDVDDWTDEELDAVVLELAKDAMESEMCEDLVESGLYEESGLKEVFESKEKKEDDDDFWS